MARSPQLLIIAVLGAAAYAAVHLTLAFVAAPVTAPLQPSNHLQRGATALRARGGGEWDVSDADIEAFYAETITGSGGDPAKGNVVSELIVKFFHGEFTKKGFIRYSGQWKGPPPGGIGKKDIKIGVEGLKAQFKDPMFVTKAGDRKSVV